MLTDIRHALRLLAHNPGFTIVAGLTLALGIGASTAIFSVAYAAILRPLPYPNPDRLVVVSVQEPDRSGRLTHTGPSLDEARAWRADGRVFSAVGVARGQSRVVVDASEPERLSVQYVSEGYLELFGVTPTVGRLITRSDVRIGAPGVAMIGERYWKRRFGSRPEIIGTALALPDGPATVVGVVPSTFDPDVSLWLPTQAKDLERAKLRSAGATTYARLRDGLSLQDSERDLTGVLAKSVATTGGSTGLAGLLEPLHDWTTSGYRSTVRTLSWAVGFVLLIACVNVAGLLLARGAARDAETAVRASLGAGRARLIRQSLTESLVLGLAGAAAGIALAWLSLDALVAIIPMSLPANSPVILSLPALGFAAVLAVVTSLLFGLVPSIRLSRMPLNARLGRTSHRLGGTLPRRAGQLLIAVEVALAVVLLVGAGLLVRSLARLESVDVGFNPEQVLMVSSMPLDRNAAVFAQYYPALVTALRTIPGVMAAGAVDLPPLAAAGERTTTARIPGGNGIDMNIRQVLPGYFEAIGLPLRSGRVFGEADVQPNSTSIVINEQAASLLFSGDIAVGRTVVMFGPPREVIGVVGNLKHGGPQWPVQAEAFYLVNAAVASPLQVVLRVSPGASLPLDRIRQAAQGVGPRVLFDGVRSGSENFGARIVTPRHRAMLFSLLGGLGLLLALVGIASMTAYAVTRRTREIGIRMAFGARPADVVRTIVKDAAWPVLIGLLIGLGGARLATKIIASFLFETTPIDPGTFAATAGVLGVAACLAAWLPARHAARVDPVVALRAD